MGLEHGEEGQFAVSLRGIGLRGLIQRADFEYLVTHTIQAPVTTIFESPDTNAYVACVQGKRFLQTLACFSVVLVRSQPLLS